MASKPILSIIIPVKNAAPALSTLLPQLTSDHLEMDVIVSDGGSQDESVEIATRHQARVTQSGGGRGPQMREGTQLAFGDWLLFLHADSTLSKGWDMAALAFMTDPMHQDHAAYFQFQLDATGPAARRLERMVAWRCRTFGLPYGDQGLLIAKGFLESLGGMPDLALMEDVALARKIGKTRLFGLDYPLQTSAEKFQRDGYLLRNAKNLTCLFLYFCGAPNKILRWIYR
ncbi:MAG: TIGR04283 family arsenosugar biosynthesis glycosyltransferase [Alphaproteobacteria bacterium]|nr:TIGR04283 family arsenosugar biosynthesis glycosyltransferase [Alphaproteobacteria bacterium]